MFQEPKSKGGTLSSIFKLLLTPFSILGEVLTVALISLAIILPIRYFLVQPFYVKGASMEPNFQEHDYLLIDEISYRFNNPKRGEVIVFRPPLNKREFFIKRVIGLPGERVQIRDGKVWVAKSGEQLQEINESYLAGVVTQGQINSTYLDVTLGDGQYYVLGDNRGASLDSRTFGPITLHEIMGRTWVRAWPFDRWQVYSY